MQIWNARIRSCAILQRLWCFFVCFLVAKFFWFTFEKKDVLSFFQKWTKKNWQLKNWYYHPNPRTISLLVIRRFSNYAKFHCSSIDRKCKKLWQPAPSLCPPPFPAMPVLRLLKKRASLTNQINSDLLLERVGKTRHGWWSAIYCQYWLKGEKAIIPEIKQFNLKPLSADVRGLEEAGMATQYWRGSN